MAETRKARREREAKEAFASVWERPGRKAPVTVEKKPAAPIPEPSKRVTGLQAILHHLQAFGFTHPSKGGWLQLPPEYDALLALERKAVAQVVLEVMRQTIGFVDRDGEPDAQGRPARVEWAILTHKHFQLALGASPTQVNTGIKIALERKYLERKYAGRGRWEYRIRWQGTLSDE
jgi:hypothetical protein